MKLARALPVAFVIALAPCGIANSQQPTANVDELTAARQMGWTAALSVVNHLSANKQPGFPGIDAWLADFNNQAKGLDPKRLPAQWPHVDIDALATRNPKFWRAYYEIAPGDPGAALLYAGLLLGGGQSNRAWHVLDIESLRPRVPLGVRNTLELLLVSAKSAWKTTEPLIKQGIELHDKGDFPGAIAKYRQALAIWPQSPSANYELAFSIRTQQILAAGERHENPGVDDRVKFTPEVKALFNQSRRYAPFIADYYVRFDAEVTQAFEGLTKIVTAMTYISQRPNGPETDRALAMLAEGCQEANVHDLALVARQVLVARRGRYDATDPPFIAKSLRQLVPGPDAEAILARLTREPEKFYRIIPVENPVPGAAMEMFTLGTPQYIKEKNAEDTFAVVVPIQVQNRVHFEEPGLKIMYVVFDEPIKMLPADLKTDPVVNADLKMDKYGEPDFTWPMKSAQQGVTLKAHLLMNPPEYKAAGTDAVVRFRLRGLPDKDIGYFIYDGHGQASKMLITRKKDFPPGDSDTIFQAMVAKLPASEPAK